jgi:hypothetical protein
VPTLTTKTAVLGTAPELVAIPDPADPEPSQWRQTLADVALEVPIEPWGDDARAELAQRLWVAHTLSLANPRLMKRALSSVSIGPTTKSYATGSSLAASDWLEQTPYGTRLMRLVVSYLGTGAAVL